MGLMSKTTFENSTDRLVQRIIAALEDDVDAITGNTETSLWNTFDATEDPSLKSAMLDPAKNVDRQLLGPNWKTYVSNFLNSQSYWGTLVKKYNSYVKSTDGGSQTNLATYINGVSATVHPLMAEMFYNFVGGSTFTYSSNIVGAEHPKMMARTFDRVWTGTMGSLTDDTTDAGDVGTADVDLFAADNDVLVLQSRYKFNRVIAQLSTLSSADVAWTWYYWNGSAWATLSVTDTTTGMSVAGGQISWTMPTDWEPYNYDMQGTPALFGGNNEEELYTVIAQRTENTVVTPPVATIIYHVQAPVYYSGTSTLFGVSGSTTIQDYQPPLAIVEITADNTATITSIQAADYTRFLDPDDGNNQITLRALTDIDYTTTTGVVFTLPFVDAGGTARTQAQTAWTGAGDKVNAGDTKNISLGAFTGLRSVTSGAATIDTDGATKGVFAVEVSGYSRSIGAK